MWSVVSPELDRLARLEHTFRVAALRWGVRTLVVSSPGALLRADESGAGPFVSARYEASIADQRYAKLDPSTYFRALRWDVCLRSG